MDGTQMETELSKTHFPSAVLKPAWFLPFAAMLAPSHTLCPRPRYRLITDIQSFEAPGVRVNVPDPGYTDPGPFQLLLLLPSSSRDLPTYRLRHALYIATGIYVS